MIAASVVEIRVKSTLDGSLEPSLLFAPPGMAPDTPLVVGLHTWSAERSNQVKGLLPLCAERNWALLLPEFRGPNLATNPRAAEACASPLAKQDIIDAMDWVLARHPIDSKMIFLIGGSGGGHMALMMAAFAPERFRAVSSWCPITDLAAWHGQNAGYVPGIEACCGGKPGATPAVDEQYRLRSPIACAEAMSRANLSVHHGRFDKSVPYSHTLNLALAIEKTSPQRFFFEIFDGGHAMHAAVAFRWFDALAKSGEGGGVALTR